MDAIAVPDETAAGWETVIGMEVHVQVLCSSKMYCSCPVVVTQELSQANRHVCPVCLGHPGTLPRPNHAAVIRALTLAAKAGSTVPERSVFARKNYFYPDLPKGYQISQYDLPLAGGGSLPYWHNGEEKRARLVRLHLEEDTAKLFHGAGAEAQLDYNRAGVPLMELVTEPDFRSGAECVSFLEELRSLLRRLGVSDAAMEAGNFRCEPNVSVRPRGTTELRTKTELKNLNSFATLRRAVESEVARQIQAYESGGSVQQATLRYDQTLGATVQMRLKETADDYRYFDDPDIPPLRVTQAMRDEAAVFDVPSAFTERGELVAFGLAHEHAATITGDDELLRFFRLCVDDGCEAQEVAKWVVGDLTRLLREAPLSVEPGELAAVIQLQGRGELTTMQAREVFEEAYRSGKTVEAVVEAKAFGGPHSEDELRSECLEVIEANPKAAADIRGGKIAAVQVLVGQVMKRTRGSADPALARSTLLELLGVSE